MKLRFERLAELHDRVGESLGRSDWITVDPSMIERFADATLDHQWLHVDAERAAAGPFGTTIAHGFLTLSLLPAFFDTAFEIADTKMGINYGLNRVRFTDVVPAGSRLRAHFKLLAFDAIAGGAQMVVEASIEREGATKPVCVAESVTRRYV
ncbi:MAG TPA: MaoC family dehydratase [Methylibium sp.]|uniref:MaoC family dehydratase n=1 Tax=Methylibium sp. TaxID=2067992 RepID=UPI002DBC30EE|nr:MaoC family dehydratase [Methylibium sp.]HEU4459818.1 MaoC family dehydratase [Methylibium sp.]